MPKPLSHEQRKANHAKVAAAIAELGEEGIAQKMREGKQEQSSYAGIAKFELAGVPVFAKRIPVSDLEMQNRGYDRSLGFYGLVRESCGLQVESGEMIPAPSMLVEAANPYRQADVVMYKFLKSLRGDPTKTVPYPVVEMNQLHDAITTNPDVAKLAGKEMRARDALEKEEKNLGQKL